MCQESRCSSDVFILAAHYVDAYLSLPRFGAVAFALPPGTAPRRTVVGPVGRNRFQLLGTAALLIASKLREAIPLSVRKLVGYTDYSVADVDLAV